MDDVAIGGLGVVSALGVGRAEHLAGLRDGRDGIGPARGFDAAHFAPVAAFGCVERGESCEEWARAAALEAWSDAFGGPPAFDPAASGAAPLDPRRVAVCAGTNDGEDARPEGVAEAVARALGARGAQLTVSTACTSSANAIGLGGDLLRAGDADVVVAGGAERLILELVAGFFRLGVLSASACCPFGESRGTTLGEGAGFVVLVRADERERLARRPWALLAGYGLASDAWHETSPHPRGEGVARATASCLSAARLAPADIDYVNVHGTGTAANDDAEWRGIKSALGPRALEIPLSASKSFLGHAQGAAGVLELAATLLCREDGAVPPTLRVGAGRPGGPPDPVAGDRPRPLAWRRALTNSAAFGGANAVLALSHEPTPRGSDGRAPARERAVLLAGVGVSDDRDGVPPGVDPRHTDPMTRLAASAASRAIEDAGLRVRGGLRDRVGVFGGASSLSWESLALYRESIERDGWSNASVAAFARLVTHAPIGAVSRAFALRGATTTLADPSLAGLLACVYAGRWLRERTCVDHLLAVGVDEEERTRPPEERSPPPLDGAACALFSAVDPDDTEAPGRGSVFVAGGAVGGPDDAAETSARALAGWAASDRAASDRAASDPAASGAAASGAAASGGMSRGRAPTASSALARDVERLNVSRGGDFALTRGGAAGAVLEAAARVRAGADAVLIEGGSPHATVALLLTAAGGW